ncbi:MAG: ribbon-helix-helix protein, CopG family [Chloroflexaceae bacterium]|jgi:predicted transcriptional regulator|nr:ribbon-helix-helix protein, CopG family [Chloroflexaceae bacterium]
MSRTVQINTRIDESTAERLDTLAEVTGRTKSRLLYEALNAYIDQEMAFLAAVEKGRADIQAGRGSDWDEVERELDALLEADQTH